MTVLDVRPFDGVHCETTALGTLLGHAGVELSEPMLFGLGEGLAFLYWDSKRLPFPFLAGRTKPMEIVRALVQRLGLTLREQETTSPVTAWRTVASAIDGGTPVGLQLDSYHLDHFRTKVHFGGHVVAMTGYDDEHAHLVDTAAQGGAVSATRASLAAARAERGPMTARHLSFTVTRDDATAPPPPRAVLGDAIRATAASFLRAPIASLGHRGIAKAATRVPGWLDRAADPARDVCLAASLMERGGTGGGLFRALYRDFLAECGTIVDDDALRAGHAGYTDAAALWADVAGLIDTAGRTADAAPLDEAAGLLRRVADVERAAMTALADVGA